MPRWDLTAYTVKQLGAEAEGGEGTRLRVRLSLQNGSERVQPMPLAAAHPPGPYGNAVATRDMEPSRLPARNGPTAAARAGPAHRRRAARDRPGQGRIGFEIDACLRADSGSIGCANDARRRAAADALRPS